MKFKVHQTELLRCLRLAQSIAENDSAIPMVANVLLRAEGKDQLLVAATDLNVSISASITSENSSSGGLTVSAKALHDVVSNMPHEDLLIRNTDNNAVSVKARKIEYRLIGMPDRDFPKIPDHDDLEFGEVDAKVLREMINRTLFSVSNDEGRFHLNGVLLELNGWKAQMVSTDGHRLSKVERTFDTARTLTCGIIIPKEGVVQIKRVIDSANQISIAIKSPYIFVRGDTMTLAVKLIESTFPPYEQVIPKNHTKEVVIDRQLLLGALKRAQLMSSETRGVKFSVSEDGLVITSDDRLVGWFCEELDAEYKGEKLSIRFNPQYVIDLLSQMFADHVTFELQGHRDPALIRGSGDAYIGVVMPMNPDE